MDVPRSEHPQPQFERAAWECLNGEWEFAFDDANRGATDGWYDGRRLAGSIVVPFPYQSTLSGIGDRTIHEVVWYARSFDAPRQDGGLLLHFGAVDYDTTVWVNGQLVGRNRGGHVPFALDVAPYVREGENRVSLRVEDRQDPHQPRGKQSVSGVPHGIDYTCSTGIWQSVWLEPVPTIRLHELRIGGDAAADALEVWALLHAPSGPWRVEVEAIVDGAIVARSTVETRGATSKLVVPIAHARHWSPEAPHLYDLRVRLFDGDRTLDEVTSYAGIRDVELRDGRFRLNGEPLTLAMVLDQGYWPDGLLAAPSDEALRADVEAAKRLGFVGARKHQKIEDPRWLMWCDRLGLLAWGEMANARAWSLEAEESLLAEWERAVRRDVNHPSIVAWVPVNESMGFPALEVGHPGQYAFLERAVNLTRRLDPSRAVVDNDGWEHTDITDVVAIHDYTPTAAGLRDRYRRKLEGGELPTGAWYRDKPVFARGARHRGQPIMLTEVGGFLDRLEGDRDRLYDFYESVGSGEELLASYTDLMEGLSSLEFLAGFCYTQLADVEQEVNGLLTADRQFKVEPARIAAVHRAVFG